MHDYTPLISILAAGFGLAFIFGYLAHRIKISPIVGYLIAGIIIGPATPGYVADINLTNELAEIGVILLMFGIGLHFSLTDLAAVKKLVIPGALLQIFFSSLLGFYFGQYLGWNVTSCIIFGLSISVASTVVLLRTLEDVKLLKTKQGHMAIGWLIVEDLSMIMVLIILPPIAMMLGVYQPNSDSVPLLGTHPILLCLFTIFKVATFIMAMFVFGRKLMPRFLLHIATQSSTELFRLAILCIALCVAFIAAKLFDVSFALGAFFAGMILSESALSHRAAEEIIPLRDAFSVLFFVSVGMLLHPITLLTKPFLIFCTTLIIMLGKSFFAFIIVFLFRYPFSTACMIAFSLAQIGEFSFILSSLGCKIHLLTPEVRDVIVAGAILSMIINPILFRFIVRYYPNLFKESITHGSHH